MALVVAAVIPAVVLLAAGAVVPLAALTALTALVALVAGAVVLPAVTGAIVAGELAVVGWGAVVLAAAWVLPGATVVAVGLLVPPQGREQCALPALAAAKPSNVRRR